MISGLRQPSQGAVTVCGIPTVGLGARATRQAGLAYVPEDRLGTGLAPSLSMVDNLLLTRDRGFLVDRKSALIEAEDFITNYIFKS